jgi:poly(3-hydroxybutyrate) depolymerase
LLYNAYELNRAVDRRQRWASVGAELLNNGDADGLFRAGSVMASALDVFARRRPRVKPQFDIETVRSAAEPAGDRSIVLHRPFGLLRFTHAGLPDNAPNLLIVAR